MKVGMTALWGDSDWWGTGTGRVTGRVIEVYPNSFTIEWYHGEGFTQNYTHGHPDLEYITFLDSAGRKVS